MLYRRNAMGGVAIGVLVLVLVGCGDSEPTTTTARPATTAPVTSTEAATTTVEVGPQRLPSSGFAEPGDYVTTVFEPTVAYRIETKHILGATDIEKVTAFQNRFPRGDRVMQGLGPYKGIAIHNHYQGLTPDEVVATLEEIGPLNLGPSVPVEVAGFPGTQIEATVCANGVLWSDSSRGFEGNFHNAFWDLETGQMMRLIVVGTPAGSLLITIGAHPDDWDDFILVAEEILAGISFPDFD